MADYYGTVSDDHVFAWGEGASFGLTKREYFAALAMQSFCSTYNGSRLEILAKDAVNAADALIEELNKERK